MSRMKMTNFGQARRVRALLSEFTPALMDNIHELECPSPRTTPDKLYRMASFDDSLQGYAYLLQSHRLRNYDTLTSEALQQLDEKSKILLQLATDAGKLFTIFHRDKLQPDAALDRYVTDKYTSFHRYGEVSIISGTPWMGAQPAHFTLIKLTKAGSDIHVTTYNAGYEALPSPDTSALVMGICKKKLHSATEKDVKKFIELHASKRHAPAAEWYEYYKSQSDGMLDSGILAYSNVEPQHKSNCSTRSPREWLHDNLAEFYAPIYQLAATLTASDHRKLLYSHLADLESKLQQEARARQPQSAQQQGGYATPPADKKRKGAPENTENDEAKSAKKEEAPAAASAPASSRYRRLQITLPPKATSFVAREVAMQNVPTTTQQGRS